MPIEMPVSLEEPVSLKEPSGSSDVQSVMRMRIESLLNLLIVLVVAVDVFIGLQVYQQNADSAVVVPAAASPVPTPVALPVADGSVEPGDQQGGAVAVTGSVTARNAVQSAVLAAQLFYVDNGTMPADSFAMQGLVPGPRFVDGPERAGNGVIGMVSTPTTILFVTSLADAQWICAAIDGPSESTQYASDETREGMSEFSGCIGNLGDWG